jgi:hypothetical protein
VLSKPDANPARQLARPSGDTALPQDGFLVVRMRGWADVWVDGKRVGTAPVRLKLHAGQYIVRLVNDAHDETVTVSVGGKAETVIEKSW